MGVGLFRLGALAAIAATASFPAAAQDIPACPANAAQTASQITQHFRTAEKIEPNYINVANNLQVACAQDYITNLTLADAWISLSQRNGVELEQKYETAARAMSLLFRVQALPLEPHNYSLAGETRKKVITQLVAIADAGGPKIDWLDGETPFPICERGFSNPAQSLWYAYKREQKSVHTPVLLASQALGCEGQERADALGYFAEYKVFAAEQADDPAQAFEYMKEARDLYDVYGGEKHTALYWNPELREAFDRKFMKAGLRVMTDADLMPLKDLFKPENMKANRSKLDLQYYIDQSWWPVARDADGKLIQDDVTERMRTHLYLIRDLAELARAEGKDAEWYLYRALKDHRENGFRSDANADADDPPEFIAEIYNPNKKTE